MRAAGSVVSTDLGFRASSDLLTDHSFTLFISRDLKDLWHVRLLWEALSQSLSSTEFLLSSLFKQMESRHTLVEQGGWEGGGGAAVTDVEESKCSNSY